MTTLAEVLGDLQDEFLELRGLVGELGDLDPDWNRATPAEGWAVRDQISHLAFFDDAGRLAMVDPEVFAEQSERFMSGVGDPMEIHLAQGRSMGGDELLHWWDEAHREMMGALYEADPKARIPWYGPPMGVLSFASARLMETWAHGQDVFEALDRERVPTDRLRHVAHLGVRARPFSYLVRGREAPGSHIRVVLAAPSGETWEWDVNEPDGGGVPQATIRGSALDFCLVVTQRRNVADTGLEVEGAAAVEWMGIAQAFAGPPGEGRAARDA